MVEKKVYIITAILALAIFLVGFMSGYSVLNMQIEQFRLGMEKNELEMRNLQLEMLFLGTLEEERFCSYLGSRLDTVYANTAELGKKLVDSEMMGKEQSEILARRYFLALIQGWIFSREFVQKCDATRIDALYFYSKGCNTCVQQGYILDYLVDKDKTRNIHIYSLDRDVNEPIIQVLAENFNITATPALVINEIVYSGFRDREFLIQKFCSIDANLTFCA